MQRVFEWGDGIAGPMFGVVIAQRRGDCLHLESSEVQRLGQAAPVEDEPFAAVAASVEASQGRRQEREGAADGVEEDQLSSSHTSHGLEAAERVAEHLQDVAHEHDIELAENVGVEVVDVEVAMLCPWAEELGRDLEGVATEQFGWSGAMLATVRERILAAGSTRSMARTSVAPRLSISKAQSRPSCRCRGSALRSVSLAMASGERSVADPIRRASRPQGRHR